MGFWRPPAVSFDTSELFHGLSGGRRFAPTVTNPPTVLISPSTVPYLPRFSGRGENFFALGYYAAELLFVNAMD